MSIVEDRELTRFCPQTDRRTRWYQYTPLSTLLKRGYNYGNFSQFLTNFRMQMESCVMGEKTQLTCLGKIVAAADLASQGAGAHSWCYYTLRFNEVESGVYWYHLVRLSVCGHNRARSVSSTILIGSISYLHILSSNLRTCVVCNAHFKISKFEILAYFLNL